MEAKRQGSTRLRDIDRENLADPPARAAIDALPRLGESAFAFDLSGLAFRFEGLDAGLAGAASRRFAAWLREPSAVTEPLAAVVRRDPREYFVTPETGGPEGYYRLRIVHAGGLVRLVTYGMAAWIDVAGGKAGIAFATGLFDPRERALENFCRVAAAWRAVERGGFFIHGASIVRNGRAYIFFGKSAAGKSTLARLNDEGRVVSDDLTLVLPEGDGLSVAGSPFRGTYEGGEPLRGRWPLAGMFRLAQDTETRVETPRPVEAFAEFVANLPFVNDALAVYPGLFERLETACRKTSILRLHFEKKPGFWKAVDAALGAPPDPPS